MGTLPLLPWSNSSGTCHAKPSGFLTCTNMGMRRIIWFTAGLFAMTVAGSAFAFVRAPRLRSSLAVAWAAVIPLCLALFTAHFQRLRASFDRFFDHHPNAPSR